MYGTIVCAWWWLGQCWVACCCGPLRWLEWTFSRVGAVRVLPPASRPTPSFPPPQILREGMLQSHLFLVNHSLMERLIGPSCGALISFLIQPHPPPHPKIRRDMTPAPQPEDRRIFPGAAGLSICKSLLTIVRYESKAWYPRPKEEKNAIAATKWAEPMPQHDFSYVSSLQAGNLICCLSLSLIRIFCFFIALLYSRRLYSLVLYFLYTSL
jgi:hypothetical protein